MMNARQIREYGESFEAEVKRIATLIWPLASGGPELIDGSEIDGIYETEEAIHVIEATVSRKKEKAQSDSKKIAKIISQKRRECPTKAIKGYFITKDEPTADQLTQVKGVKADIAALSFDQFRRRVIDVRAYLELRDAYPFGSAKNLRKNSYDPASLDSYICLDIVSKSGNIANVQNLCESLTKGNRCWLTGDFGAGKSMTVREIFKYLKTSCYKDATCRFPICLNLRDHQGQINPSEALRRHAEAIGYPHPDHIVRAWRAGFAILILDGVDEMATFGWTARAKKLSEIRYDSMKLIRELVQQSPVNCGLMLAGRGHFFDSMDQALNTLGLTNTTETYTLSEFNETQISEYIQNQGWSTEIPEWLPSRPYLLGELIATQILESDAEWLKASSPGLGWDQLLDRIATRESDIGRGLSPDTVRTVIERLASFARCTTSGRGPISESNLMNAFQDVCGYPPDDSAYILLQRLPGLGLYSQAESSREFVDDDLADAARCGDLLRFSANPYNFEIGFLDRWEKTCGPVGIELVSHKINQNHILHGQLNPALAHAALNNQYHVLAMDILRSMIASSVGCDNTIVIKGVAVDNIDFMNCNIDLSSIRFQDCYFHAVSIDGDFDYENLPSFSRCLIGDLIGMSSINPLPDGKIDNQCIIERYSESVLTTAGILAGELALGVRILLTLIKKIYIQAGRGRRENALFRGLDQHARRIVPEILALLKRHDLVVRSGGSGETIWLPVRNKRPLVTKILSNPHADTFPVVAEAKAIAS